MTAAPDGLNKEQILTTLALHNDALRHYSVRRIGLFGSYARGEQTSRSDVDFLVQLERPTYDNFYDLSVALERLFHKRIELVTDHALSPRMRPFVEKEVVWHDVG